MYIEADERGFRLPKRIGRFGLRRDIQRHTTFGSFVRIAVIMPHDFHVMYE